MQTGYLSRKCKSMAEEKSGATKEQSTQKVKPQKMKRWSSKVKQLHCASADVETDDSEEDPGAVVDMFIAVQGAKLQSKFPYWSKRMK